jgi:hypothetical protein
MTDLSSTIDATLVGKGLSASSISTYLKNVARLNDDKPIKNLNFLADVDGILGKLGDYKDNTKRSYLISIVSVLNAVKDGNKKLTKLHQKYYDEMDKINNKIKAEPANTKSDTQSANWMEWKAIKEKYDEIKKECHTNLAKKKEISEAEYGKVLEMVVLSLYLNIPPRRNQDYQECSIVADLTDLPMDTNYLLLTQHAFIFNKYKTFKKHGQQFEQITPPLWEDIVLYLRFHPLIKGSRGAFIKTLNVPFLVHYNGSGFAPNSITRILNKCFGKKIGSSMLRHIFLTDKYGDTLNDMQDTAEAMAHTISTQKDYIKNK